MTCNGIKGSKHEEVEMVNRGDSYWQNNIHYQKKICPECENETVEILNKWMSGNNTRTI